MPTLAILEQKTMSYDQEAEAEELRKKWGFKKKQLCQTFPKGCLNCFNPHCSENKKENRSSIVK